MSVPGDGAAAMAAAERDLLYVEDNPLNVLLMRALLEQRPHWRLRVAAGVDEAVAAALAAPPHLLLLDMHLPDGDGIALLARLRTHAALRAVPAIAVSADALESDIRAARAAGFDGYWTKPLHMGCVLAELDTRLGA
ncbi:response regulator [Azohydromonas aeria]|uniref:response regulator n=1 Tax=Azohydromonas aeria TaxID=2590212 RepID=UPI0012FB5ACD|nr:response regulator [Azohydromonas aeria]